MCGIAGFVGYKELSEDRVQECLVRMRRRGPDHAAVRRWSETGGRQVYLLHSRLNIIDLDARANQPFKIGEKYLTYNGEIYNYVELREQLRFFGERLNTESDTEVLLRMVDRCGWSALDAFEGMWAFALYDAPQKRVSLSRDRFGEKPLYLYEAPEGLYFGSEIKFIFALLGGPLPVDTDHLYRYLINGYKALYKQRRTFFRGLSELTPGTVLHLGQDGRRETQRYWKPSFEPDLDLSYEEAVKGVRDRLLRSVQLRLRADVPLAFCMSGGVDSNALISTAKRVFGYDVHGFTISNVDSRYEEGEMVDYAVRELGIRHSAVPVQTDRFLERLRELVRYHDAPVSTITYYAHWLLMEQIAREGYRISVSGTAADELFSGYYDHHLAYLYEVRGEPALHQAARDAWQAHIKPIVRNPFLGNPDAFIENPTLRDHIFLNADEFSQCLKRPWSEPFSETTFTVSLLRNRMLNEMFHEAVPVILHEDDLNAMYFSIENRSPYLDRELFEFCYRIPSAHLIRDGMAKALLRDAMESIMPEKVRTNRRKVGFNAPIHSFLDVREPATRRAVLADSPIFDHLRRDAIEALLDKSALPNSESKFLFYFLSSKMFLEEFSA